MQVGEGEETKGKQESWDMSPCSYCEPAVRWQAIFTSAIRGLQGLGSGGEWNAVHVHDPMFLYVFQLLFNPLNTEHSILSGHPSCQLEARTIYAERLKNAVSSTSHCAALSDSPRLQFHRNYYCEVRDQSWLQTLQPGLQMSRYSARGIYF